MWVQVEWRNYADAEQAEKERRKVSQRLLLAAQNALLCCKAWPAADRPAGWK
jgi:hypothetical protein